LWNRFRCQEGYNFDESKTNCVITEYSVQAKILAYVTISLLTLIILIDIVYTLMPKEFNSQAYSTIDYTQKLLVLVLIGTYYPEGILHYFEIIKLALFSFSFFGLNETIKNWTNYGQTDQRLAVLGLASNSGISNIAEYFLVFINMLILYIVFKIIKWFYSKSTSSMPYSISDNLTKVIKVNWSIRYLILGINLVFLSTASEIKKYNKKKYEWSWCASFVIFSTCITGIIYTWIYTFLWFKIPLESNKELFRGLKKNNLSRCCPIISLTQKMIATFILIFSEKAQPVYHSSSPEEEINPVTKISSLISVQILLLL
jgi:hypothetical protein